MYEIVVATHGKLGSGLEDTMNMILGEQENIHFLQFLQNDDAQELRGRYLAAFNVIDKEHDILVLTDLFGGTPCNVVSKIALENKQRIRVLCGVSLPMLIASISSRDTEIGEAVEKILAASKEGTLSINFNFEDLQDDE